VKFCNKCGDPIELNELYCNKCGNYLGSNQVSQNNIQFNDGITKNVQNNQSIQTNLNNNFNFTNSDNNGLNNNQYDNNLSKDVIKKALIGVVSGTFLLLIIFGAFLISKNKSTKYYFDTNYNENSSEISENSGTKTAGSSSSNGKYATSIIYDNTYSGVSIKDAEGAIALIKEDSENQKTNCSSEITNIEKELIDSYGITAVNLCEMDTEFASELSNVFKKIYNEYPAARGYITNLTLYNTTIRDQSVIAAFMPVFNFATSSSSSTYPWIIKTQVILNSSYFLNKDKLVSSVTDGSNSGHFPKNATIYSPVAHELGHYLSFIAMMNNYSLDSVLLIDSSNVSTFYKVYNDFVDGNYSLEMITEAYNNYKKDTNTTLSFDEFRGTISGYALAKDNSGEYIYDETIAEAFHDVYLNGNQASDASKYIVEVLKSKLEG
jgi:hypothetical protein